MTVRRRTLTECRKAAGYSQEKLAEALRVEPSTVGRWERGETCPQPWARPKLARALGISNETLAELLNEVAGSKSTASTPGLAAEEVEAIQAARSTSKAAVPTWAFMSNLDQAILKRTKGSCSVSLADIEALHAVQCSLVALDAEYGGGDGQDRACFFSGACR